MYASIINVYTLASNYANKQQQGFVTGSEFNSFAESAQMELFKELTTALSLALVNEQRFITFSRGNYGGIENILDDLNTLLVYDAALTGNVNVYALPDDYGYKSVFTYKDREIELLDGVKMSMIKRGNLNAPSVLHPVGMLSRNTLTVLPNSILSNVKATYYKVPESVNPSGMPQPQPPFLGFDLTAGIDSPKITGYRDFEMPVTCEYKLAARILNKIGINIREEVLMQWANNEKQQQVNG